MRKLWIGTLLAPFVLSLTATKAAVEPSQEQITVLSSEATYVGPLLHDQALRQRQSLQREQRTGVIDVYNVWTSDVKVKLNSALRVTGHSYQSESSPFLVETLHGSRLSDLLLRYG